MCVVRAQLTCIRNEIVLMSVQECGIGTRGAVHLFEALRDNSTLQRLSVRDNAISSLEGAADASSRFEVRALDMSSNRLSSAVVPNNLVNALGECSTIDFSVRVFAGVQCRRAG